jgi:glutamine amidotransferase
MIVVINYGMGNLSSILNMLKKIGTEAIISSNISDIEKAQKLILPGVGAFDNGMRNLHDLGFTSLLNDKIIENKTPILGICLGMHLFTKRSEEGERPGLGWINAETIRFRFDKAKAALKIPHMRWNTIKIQKQNPLFNDFYKEPRFYFAHSYHVHCKNEEDVLTKTYYGHDFVSSIMKDNILGVQFHPEKSLKYGMKFLDNFVKLY